MIEVTSLLDQRLLRILAQFSVTPHGQAVLAWLESCRIKQLEELSELEDVHQVKVAQGATQAYRDLIEAIMSAKPLIEQSDQRT
jgi:hypothetical protein